MSLTRRKTHNLGCIQLEDRKGTPVWIFRYWDRSNGERHKRKEILGTVAQLPRREHAERAAEVFRLRANRENPEVPPPTMEALVQRFLTDVLPPIARLDNRDSSIPGKGEMSPQCARGYRSVIKTWVVPRWTQRADGRRYLVRDFERIQMSTAIEQWLKSLARRRENPKGLATKTVCHIRSIMYAIFKWGVKWGYIAHNPIGEKRVELWRGSSKREQAPRSLSPVEFESIRRLFTTTRERLLIELGGRLGTRISEAMGLKWRDLDLNAGILNFQQSFVAGRMSAMKTEASRTTVPLPPEVVSLLITWRGETPYRAHQDWVFASPVHNGDRPLWAGTLLKFHIQPVVRAAGLGEIGWHTLRHSYAAWCKAAGLQPGQMQAAMRHEDPGMSLRYGTPDIETKRELSNRVAEYLRSSSSESKAANTMALEPLTRRLQ